MINNERVRHMVKMQAFRNRNGKDCFKINQYYRVDFVGLHMLKAFISVTVVFGICLGLWGVCNMTELMETIHTMDLKKFITDLLLRYAACAGIYLAIVYIYAHATYTKMRKGLKTYSKHLKKVAKSLEEKKS